MNARLDAFLETLGHNAIQALIAFDCLCNVLVSTITLQQGYGTETLSAHAWRARQKFMGMILRPLIDLLFSWQALDDRYLDDFGKPITSHCQRAFLKERAKDYLPPEYL